MSRAFSHQRSALRGRLEAAIETAITTLDWIDGDADFESDASEDGGDDEPSLCGVYVGGGSWDGGDLEHNVVRPFQWDQRRGEGVPE